MKTTTNYGLNKIELQDSPPNIEVLNPNWDKIDGKLKELSDESKNSDNKFTEHLEYHVKSYVVSTRERTKNDPNYGI